MTFESDKAAYYLFVFYARCMGFAIKRDTSYRSRKTGELAKFQLACNRQRQNVTNDNPTKERKSNFIVITNCQVRVLVKKEGAQWFAATVNLHHNHELMSSEWLVRFMRCHRNISDSDKKFISILQKSRVAPRQVMTIFRSLKGSFRNFNFDEADISNIAAAEKKQA